MRLPTDCSSVGFASNASKEALQALERSIQTFHACLGEYSIHAKKRANRINRVQELTPVILP